MNDFLLGLIMFICLVPSVVLLYVMMYPKNWQKKQRIFGVNNRPEFKTDKSAEFIDIVVNTHKKQGTAILIGILVISTLLLFVPGLTIKMIVWTVFVYIALVVICIPYALGNSELKKYKKANCVGAITAWRHLIVVIFMNGLLMFTKIPTHYVHIVDRIL